MTFHSIVRQWCKTYRYMMDSPQNRRFFLTDSPAGVVELVKNLSDLCRSCVVMESSVEGGGPLMRPSRNYPVYFFVKAAKMADGDKAAEAKEEAWVHACNFLSWLRAKHEEEASENTDGDFARINLEDYIDIQSVGPIQDGWFAVLIQFERQEPISLCVDWDLYEDCNEHG